MNIMVHWWQKLSDLIVIDWESPQKVNNVDYEDVNGDDYDHKWYKKVNDGDGESDGDADDKNSVESC